MGFSGGAGVEWRCAETSEGLVVNLCNHRKEATTVVVSRRGGNAAVRDVLASERTENPVTLAPLEVRLLRVAKTVGYVPPEGRANAAPCSARNSPGV